MSPGHRGDGRNIDPVVAELTGEGAEQRVSVRRSTASPEVWSRPPADADGATTYYGRPVLKVPVWTWEVPTYFFAGGTAGAAAVIAASAQLLGREEMRGLTRRARYVAAAGSAAGTVLLIRDLGRPERFLNMLRVFKATSPLNLGSWILAAAGSLTAGSALLARSGGVLRFLGDVAGLAAGVAGAPLAGYTGVLLAGTAVPAWSEARRTLPLLFVASATSSAAGLLLTSPAEGAEGRALRRLAVAGAIGELVAGAAMDRETGRIERAGAPYKEGISGRLWKASKYLTVAGLLLGAFGGRSRTARAAAGALGAAGSLALRFGVFHAGRASARDPRATFDLQRGRG